MALHQHTLSVAANQPTGTDQHHGSSIWASGLVDPKLISATVLLPSGGNLIATRGTHVRARVDADLITVEVFGDITGRVDVLVTLEA